jgi:hypothetical protein
MVPVEFRARRLLESTPMSSSAPIPPELVDKRISELSDEIDATTQRLTQLRDELQWYEAAKRLFGDAPPDPAVEPSLPGLGNEAGAARANGAKPTLREAILTVMREEPRKTWKVESVISELRQREWLPGGEHGEHRTRSVLAQMHRKGQAKRIDRGRYRLPPEPK